MIIVPTVDGFFEVWRDGRCISGEHPFVSRQMAQGWINQHLAQAGEAGTAETENTGSVHEHAVAKGDAP